MLNLYSTDTKSTILAGLTEAQVNPKIAKMLKCDICRGYLAVSMVSPIRCPGMDYREINGKKVPYTSTGIPWDEYIQSYEDLDNKRREAYIKEHKAHLIEHGIIK